MVTKYANLIKRLPSWIYKILAQIWYDKEYPRHIFIELTSACNLSCDYCPRPKEAADMDWSTFRRIIDEAQGHGPRSFSLHLLGEPLLYPRLLEACSYIKRSNPRHTILLTTNGTLLPKYYESLVGVGLDKIIWSFKKGQIIPKEAFKWEKLTIRFIQGEELPFPRREVRSLHNYGGTMPRLSYGARSTAGKRYPCYHLWYAPAVSANGDILICCADPMKKSVIGNIKTMTLSQAWKKMEMLREEQLQGTFRGICSSCNVYKSYPCTFFSSQYTT